MTNIVYFLTASFSTSRVLLVFYLTVQIELGSLSYMASFRISKVEIDTIWKICLVKLMCINDCKSHSQSELVFIILSCDHDVMYNS